MRLKRYPNRALFDLDRQKWVKLTEVLRAIRKGEELSVVTGKNNRDCTSLVLVQLVYAEALKGAEFPSGPLVRLLEGLRSPSNDQTLQRLDEEILGEFSPRKR